MELAKIEHGNYVQGDLKFQIDAADAHKTFDAVAALSNADKIKLAKLNGIVAEPYNKNMLTTILKSVVQNAWFANKLGNIPTEVLSGHNARLAQYTAAISAPTSSIDLLAKKGRAASKTRNVLLYTLDDVRYESEWANWMGQSYLVVKSMRELGAKDTTGKSVRDIFDNIKGTRETKAPTRNAVSQIVNKLLAAGIVTLLNPQDAKQKAAKKPAAPTPAPKAAPAPQKKKH